MRASKSDALAVVARGAVVAGATIPSCGTASHGSRTMTTTGLSVTGVFADAEEMYAAALSGWRRTTSAMRPTKRGAPRSRRPMR